jgi:hypothetical protein
MTELEDFANAPSTLALREIVFAEIIRIHLEVEVSVFEYSPASVKQVLTNIKVELLDHIAQRRKRIKFIFVDARSDLSPPRATSYGSVEECCGTIVCCRECNFARNKATESLVPTPFPAYGRSFQPDETPPQCDAQIPCSSR